MYYTLLDATNGKVGESSLTSNFDNDPSLSTLHKLSAKVKTNNKVHKDLKTECFLLKKNWYEDEIGIRKIKDRVRFFSISPFIVHIFCEKN